MLEHRNIREEQTWDQEETAKVRSSFFIEFSSEYRENLANLSFYWKR